MSSPLTVPLSRDVLPAVLLHTVGQCFVMLGLTLLVKDPDNLNAGGGHEDPLNISGSSGAAVRRDDNNPPEAARNYLNRSSKTSSKNSTGGGQHYGSTESLDSARSSRNPNGAVVRARMSDVPVSSTTPRRLAGAVIFAFGHTMCFVSLARLPQMLELRTSA